MTSVSACEAIAKTAGATVFSVQDGKQCFGKSTNAKNSYRLLGPSTQCGDNGLGGPWANHVYEVECGKEAFVVGWLITDPSLTAVDNL